MLVTLVVSKGCLAQYLFKYTFVFLNTYSVSAQIVKVDGEKIKADTWYTMMNGEIVEA